MNEIEKMQRINKPNQCKNPKCRKLIPLGLNYCSYDCLETHRNYNYNIIEKLNTKNLEYVKIWENAKKLALKYPDKKTNFDDYIKEYMNGKGMAHK